MNDAQEEEPVKVEDDDGQGDRADVEDPAGEEEAENGAEGLDKVDLVLQGLLELLAAGGGLLFFLLVVEGEQLGADLDQGGSVHGSLEDLASAEDEEAVQETKEAEGDQGEKKRL